MKKTVLIIGAGFGQIPAIQKARSMGFDVVAIDKNPDAIGMPLATYSYPIDVLDVQGAIKVAKNHKIDGVMTMQTDLPVPTVGSVVDALNLKGSGLNIAERCSNKIETRLALSKAKVPQPKFEIISTFDEAIRASKKIGFPLIIKSPDNSGSRGVSKVSDIGEINNAIEEAYRYSRKNKILIEEYIKGIEIGAQAFSVDGKCIKVLAHNDTVALPPYMVPTGHSFPIDLPKAKEKIIESVVATAVEALGIKDGPSNIDLIIDSDNNPQIIEVGARIGATCLPELVNYYCGIDWVEQAINSCLGLKVDLNDKYYQPVVAYILQSPNDGIMKSYNIPDSVKNHPNLLEVEITANIGERVNILRKGTDRIGKIIVKGKTVDEANRIALDLIKEIEIIIDKD